MSLPGGLAWAMTFLVLLITWVFFRSESITVAVDYLGALIGQGAGGEATAILSAVIFARTNIVLLVTCAAVAWLMPNTQSWLKRLNGWKVVAGFGLIFISVREMGLQGFNPFLYFQF